MVVMRRLLGLTLAALTGCSDATVTPDGEDDPFANPVFLTAVADVAACDSQGDEATSAIVDTLPGIILMAGDIAYEAGTAQQFADCYHPSWGRHRDRTRPAPGNHEYETSGAAPYYQYFGERAGPAGRGYYSFDVGDWHIVSLNSNIDMTPGSPQEQWLRQDLAANPARCTIAFWHHPLFSSGFHSANPAVAPLWKALEEAGAEIVIAGHDHHYESFAPQNSAGAPTAQGIRQFIVGNGGRSLFPALFSVANSLKRYDTGYGVLRLTLGDGAYEWRFIPVIPGDFSDTGRATCR
jgi:hypothetical protein